MANDERIFTVQPRFQLGDYPTGWSLIDGLFHMGEGLPPYGTTYRDSFLMGEWQREPMTAGVFSTWVEKCQTVEWKITGGRNLANKYARMLHEADGGAGWSYHEGVCAISYLATDKGSMEELGREAITDKLVKQLQNVYLETRTRGQLDQKELKRLIAKATTGLVVDIQHIDSTRMVKIGLPDMRWRYYPEGDTPTGIPDKNIIQILSMPSGLDAYRGFGNCALSRIIEAKNLMLGYLTYYRQEIGDLPPELAVIINGLSETAVKDSLTKYKMDREAKNLDHYGKVWWLGSDDPMTPVSMTVQNLTSPTKSFNFQAMMEWFMKLLALNVGEDVGEFWLLQKGESKTVQSIQSQKAKGKGVAKYLQDKERRYNTKVLPYGVRFQYDQTDDDADQQQNDILATKITNLKNLASIGVDRQEPAFTIDQVSEIAKHWGILPPEMAEEDVPVVLGAMVKQVAEEGLVTIYKSGRVESRQPLLKSDQDLRAAKFVLKAVKQLYLPHQATENVEL